MPKTPARAKGAKRAPSPSKEGNSPSKEGNRSKIPEREEGGEDAELASLEMAVQETEATEATAREPRRVRLCLPPTLVEMGMS